MNELELIKINDWLFDSLNSTLTLKSSSPKIADTVEELESKHCDLLMCLITHNGEVVSRDKLIEVVWKNRFIDDRTINATISRLRKLLGGSKNEYIKTHPKVGYSLTCQPIYIERPTQEKIKEQQQEKRQLAFYKTYVSISVLSVVSLLWFLLTSLNPPHEVLTEDQVKIEPMTYESGWNDLPNLSHDGKFLTYTNLQFDSYEYTVKIQDVATKKTLLVDQQLNSYSSVWSPKRNRLFYSRTENRNCYIYHIDVDFNNGEFNNSSPEQVTSCGSSQGGPSMALSQDEKWLYFTFIEEDHSPFFIKRVNLLTNTTEQLTLPNKVGNGDTEIALSPNDKKLAIIRSNSTTDKHLVILDINTKTTKSFNNITESFSTIDWYSDNWLVIANSNNSLSLFNPNNEEFLPIVQFDNRIDNPVFISNDTLLISYGDLSTLNIEQIDLSQDPVQTSPLINSTFNDYSADTFIAPNSTEVIIFSSDRSGSYQLWIKNSAGLKQLTDIKDKVSKIEEIEISPAGSHILFKQGSQFYVYELANKILTALSSPGDTLGNAIWQCNSNNTILMTAKESGEWHSFQIPIDNQKPANFIRNTNNIFSDCANEFYYFTRPHTKGIFQSPANTLTITEHFLAERELSPIDWFSVGDKQLFFGNTIFNITANEETSKIPLINSPLSRIKFSNNKLLLSVSKSKNTHVAKITIPNLRNAINLQ